MIEQTEGARRAGPLGRWKLIVAAAAVIVALLLFALRFVDRATVVIQQGGGPPPSNVAPPFPSATPAGVITSLSLASGEPCDLLDAATVSSLIKATVVPAGSKDRCTYAGENVRFEVELRPVAHYQAFASEAQRWPGGPEVLYAPAYSLFFVDAERSALVVNAEPKTLILRLTDARLDRIDHRARLARLAAAVGGGP